MGINPIRRDNIMQNMALEANALEYERKRNVSEQKSKGKLHAGKAGKICFFVLLAILLVIVGAYVIYHV